MLFQVKEKMQVVKDLYHSRHYTQCAQLGERLLAEAHEMHPVHLAYLNFYTAISHDTLAREATLRNRVKELDLAEKYYTAAVTALRPPKPQRSAFERQSPPTSAASNESRAWKRRGSNASSFDSTTSSASSATSYHSDAQDSEPELSPKPFARISHSHSRNSSTHSRSGSKTFRSNSPVPLKLLERRNLTVAPLRTRPQTPQEQQFAADTSAFIRMMENHLASVRELKTKTCIPVVRFTFPSPPSSPTEPKPRTSKLFDAAEAEVVQKKRRSVIFRPRFDPSSVRKLCNEALAELS